MPLNKNEVESKVLKLQNFWLPRNKKFKEWYEQIQMIDTLAQRDMESFVGNDPRASFNLISGILNQKIPHRLPPETVGAEQVIAAADLSKMFEVIWENITYSYRQRGRQWLDDLVNFILATGWYTVFASMTLDGSAAFSEVWNPATVFPMWDDTLVECAHIFTPGEVAVRRMAERSGWILKQAPGQNTTIKDYWWLEQAGQVTVILNSILVGTEQVKPATLMPQYKRIPIFVAPVGGLPDTGELTSSKGMDRWKAEVGQSFIATNENVYRTSNKWWTFIQQLLRDTAQPRTFERTSNPKQIVNPETWYRRGAHYKLGPNDEIGFITPPPIPVELRSMQLDLEAMEQRGGPSWAMFGATQQRVTAFAMSQIAATTHQVSKAYHRGIVDCISDIDNFLYEMIKDNNFKPYGIGLPSGLPERAKLSADYELRIPGDLIQKATTSRMLNPNFILSDEYIIEHNFPEIKSPIEELARVRASKARSHPIYAQISLIEALRREAQILRDVKDLDGANLYEKSADRLEKELLASQQQPPPQETPPPGVRPEVRPPKEERV